MGIDLPLNGNAGARARAAAALTQAGHRYLAVQATVRAELRSGVARLARAREVLRVWDEEVLESLQIERQQAVKAYEAGETPLYTMLDTGRRLVTARRAALDARVDLLHGGDHARSRDRPELRVSVNGGDSAMRAFALARC